MATEKEARKFNFWPAFKNFAIIFSFVVNFILILVLLLSPGPLLMAKSQLAEPLLDDLDAAFEALGETEIETTVDIDEEIPVQFILQLDQVTEVVVVEPVPLNAPATFQLPGWGGSINGTVSLNLPVSMTLPVALSLEVPVDESVPVQMEVDVVIGLNEAG
ncbi:MAG: hypothetical protein U9Q70_01870, partial [Chloroflexota bacterium]|nr:hypothetical protein [Chloroflexota bacterium]